MGTLDVHNNDLDHFPVFLNGLQFWTFKIYIRFAIRLKRKWVILIDSFNVFEVMITIASILASKEIDQFSKVMKWHVFCEEIEVREWNILKLFMFHSIVYLPTLKIIDTYMKWIKRIFRYCTYLYILFSLITFQFNLMLSFKKLFQYFIGKVVKQNLYIVPLRKSTWNVMKQQS